MSPVVEGGLPYRNEEVCQAEAEGRLALGPQGAGVDTLARRHPTAGLHGPPALLRWGAWAFRRDSEPEVSSRHESHDESCFKLGSSLG